MKGDYFVGLLDSNHVLLRRTSDDDFTSLWCRKTWYIGSLSMSISRWTIDFRPDQESSLALVWVNFLGLSLPLFEKSFLLKLNSLLGHSLKVDEATATLKRPFVARMLVELDVKDEPKNRIWIGDDTWGFW